MFWNKQTNKKHLTLEKENLFLERSCSTGQSFKAIKERQAIKNGYHYHYVTQMLAEVFLSLKD